MANWVAATEESTTVASAGGSLPGRRGSSAPIEREPAGAWHAVDTDTGRVACGTSRDVEVWADRPWATPGVAERCPDCAAAVPVSG